MTYEDLKAKLPPHITLAWLIERSTEEGSCWIWNGKLNTLGYPVTCLAKGYTPVRRIAAVLAGKPFADRQPVAVTCHCRQCVRPEHVRPSDPASIGKAAAKRGRWKSAARAAKISAVRRANTTISDEAVQAIRLAERGQLKAICAEHGVTYSSACAIRGGRMRRDYSSPWAGMGAR